MRRRLVQLLSVAVVACGILLFQNFQYVSAGKPQEKTLLPANAENQVRAESQCVPGDRPVALLRIIGLRSGRRVSVQWNDYQGAKIEVQNVTLPLALGECETPSGDNELKICPDQMGQYLDLKVITEDREFGTLSAPVGVGCESNPVVLEVALQGGTL